ncbi:hypothetical protein SAMN05446037_105717 [Anaerovirgula multivorans]|uniref:Uncharacterized protein n=1 Tax=Anaerovirgula multivorans TaxID=312168 RepID=A0A239KYT6_9FIRM|nr:hypothetical protein [Anaerovirgula multivorans]SNT22912.1 hypothetical protein SAMN05446037_105717 [Anaerovirgula multivorans]
MKNRKLLVLILVLLLMTSTISMNYADSYSKNDSQSFGTYYISDVSWVLIVITVKFNFDVDTTGDRTIYQQYYTATVVDGNNRPFSQRFAFNNTHVRKNSNVLGYFWANEWINTSIIYDPKDIVRAQRCGAVKSFSSPTAIRASYQWSSQDCNPNVKHLDTTINF